MWRIRIIDSDWILMGFSILIGSLISTPFYCNQSKSEKIGPIRNLHFCLSPETTHFINLHRNLVDKIFQTPQNAKYEENFCTSNIYCIEPYYSFVEWRWKCNKHFNHLPKQITEPTPKKWINLFHTICWGL